MLTPTAALWFLPFTLPVSLWVAWSDMKFMKIPNKAVMATALVYLAVGLGLVALAVLPLKLWLWGWALLAIVLAIGFVMSTAGVIGAGDAKFAAAMAPFFVGSHILFVLALFAACLVAAFVSHRLLKHTPPFRRATPDWASWTHPKFPMGLALAGTLVFYLLAAILL